MMTSMKRYVRNAVVASMVLVAAASCHWGDTCYHRYAPVGDGWGRTDTLCFDLPALEAGEGYRLYVDVRYTEAYPYYDLWLLVHHNMADSLNIQTDTLRCRLHEEGGTPSGRGITGLYEVEIPSVQTVSDGSKAAAVKLTHCMAGGSVDGITDVGIRIGRHP